jgi:hypothetical protein
MYANLQGRFTSADPLMASGKVGNPQSWNRYPYVLNRPLSLIDPSGLDVQILDGKARQDVLSTLPENVRRQVEKRIDKNGLLKKGSLDKIKSSDANFLDLKAGVNAKGTIEVMSAAQDPSGFSFDYESLDEARQLRYEMNVANGMTEADAKADADKFNFDNDRVQTIYGGKTLSPQETGNGNWRVIVSYGTGQTRDMPQVERAATMAEELYVHAVRGIRGQTWKHEYNQLPLPRGPVDNYTLIVRDRTRAIYNTPSKKP